MTAWSIAARFWRVCARTVIAIRSARPAACSGTWVRYEQRNFDVQTTRDEKRYIAGINYYPMGNNFNIKAGVARLIPVNAPETNQFTIQLQVYYY